MRNNFNYYSKHLTIDDESDYLFVVFDCKPLSSKPNWTFFSATSPGANQASRKLQETKKFILKPLINPDADVLSL